MDTASMERRARMHVGLHGLAARGRQMVVIDCTARVRFSTTAKKHHRLYRAEHKCSLQDGPHTDRVPSVR
jgi:hypothetical protein